MTNRRMTNAEHKDYHDKERTAWLAEGKRLGMATAWNIMNDVYNDRLPLCDRYDAVEKLERDVLEYNRNYKENK